jgi:mRNA interferase MazF
MPEPTRGDNWLAEFSPTRGREQSGKRPALIISVDRFNHGPTGLVVAIPLTTTERRVPLHVRIEPPEAGLRATSFVMCEAVRSISKDRLIDRWGCLTRATLAEIEDRLRVLMGL